MIFRSLAGALPGAGLLLVSGVAAVVATHSAPVAELQLRVDSLPSPAGVGSAQPNFTVDPRGRVYLSWLEPVTDGHAFRYSVFEGGRWSAPQQVVARSDFFVNWADFPSMHVMSDGTLAAHWLQRTGSGTYAYGVRVSQSRDAGRSWSAPVTPHRDSSDTEHGFVAMWREQSGVGMVWLDGRNFNSAGGRQATNEMMLLTTTVLPGGGMSPEITLDERTCDCCQNSAAMTSQGPIVAYRDRSPDEIRDIYVTRRVNGVWSRGVPVHSDNWRINACPVNGPAVAAAGNRVALAWFTAANDAPKVQVSVSRNAGANFAAPIRIDGGNPVGRVDVAFLPDSSALVVWVERMGGDTAAVRARRVATDGRLGNAFTIAASSAARASGFPRMAVSGESVLFAWTQAGRPSNVRVARVAVSALR